MSEIENTYMYKKDEYDLKDFYLECKVGHS